MYPRVTRTLFALFMVLCAMPAFAQQTGTISGKVLDQSGAAMPGVTVEARSTVLPGPRVTVSGSNGSYQLAALPPGDYTVTFTLSGMQTVTRKVQALLAQDVAVNATMSVQSVSETVNVTATAGYIEKTSAAINSTLSSDIFNSLPVGTEYRDLVKLIPGVMYTQDAVRGPSAGGSGQDNVYNFDGVNVTLPLFGTLASEPASHDIAQIAIVKGGARAIDFNRAGGFNMDSVSKSGTSKFSGEASFRLQAPGMRGKLVTCTPESTSVACNNQGKMYVDVNFGGPAVKDKVFFYGSYYQPRVTRASVSNAYGPLPDYTSNRYEGFGKLTLTPWKGVLLNASWRESTRKDKGSLFGSFATTSTGTGNEASQRILTGDGSWIINEKSFLSFKLTHFGNPTAGTPDNLSSAVSGTTIGTRLDIAALDQQGLFTVPLANQAVTAACNAACAAAANTFRQSLINRYGYDANGIKNGGGVVGFGSDINDQDFFRNAAQIGYNLTVNTGQTRHEFHVGYQRYVDAEDLTRSSNGWGSITAPGGSTTFPATGGTPIFYQAVFSQQGAGLIPKIHSEYHSQSVELNDAISFKNLTVNLGVLASNDTLFGQGLNEAPGTLSGYIKAVGNLTQLRRYKMYEIPWEKMVQPRLSATYAYDGKNTVYGSWAKYNPAASSLPRAASWDRALTGGIINAYFDANGVLFGSDSVASSSGKLFVPDMTPRTTEEYLAGTARTFGNLSTRIYFRYRHSTHFWEDTNNNARVAFRTSGLGAPDSVPNELYIPDLSARLAQIGSGSSYVIAELDGAYTKYKEVTTEAEWHGNVAGHTLFLRGSYTWSHYFGNVDQDNSTAAGGNDFNTFIGSSNLADGIGRQVWDYKEGDLHGDRRHMVKVYGTYSLPWNASVGFYAVAQSGQPWEAWDRTVYTPACGSAASETICFAEKAGSRLTPNHHQVDLNYTQSFTVGKYRVQLVGDLYNIYDQQTGYNPQPRKSLAAFGSYFNYYEPRRLQLTAKIGF